MSGRHKQLNHVGFRRKVSWVHPVKERMNAPVPSVKMSVASSQSLTTMVVEVRCPELASTRDLRELERWMPK